MELVLLCFLGVLGEHFGCSPGLAVDPLGWRGRGGRGPTGRTADSWAPQGPKGQKRVFCALFVPAGSAVADADHWWADGLGCKTYSCLLASRPARQHHVQFGSGERT